MRIITTLITMGRSPQVQLKKVIGSIANEMMLIMGLVFISANVYAASQYAPVDVAMNVNKIAAHSYYVQGAAGMATENAGFISNAGFVVTNQGVVVIDGLGSPSLAWMLTQQIRKLTEQPIVKVIVTHYHADHIYGLQVFKELGAKIIAPRGVYEYLDSAAARERLEERRFSLEPWVNEKTYLVSPDQVVDNELRFKMGEIDFRINYLGSAHSTGDLTVYVEQDKVLYSGDIIFEGRIPFVGDADTKTWLKTLAELETSELVALVPGHGPAADQPVAAIARNREYLAYLRQQMGNAVDEFTEFARAYEETDWSSFSELPAFEAANRRNAYQVYLSMEAESMK